MIKEFQGSFRWLSNFWIDEVGFCVEKAFQSAKFEEGIIKQQIIQATTPGKAKRLANEHRCEIKEGWDEKKLEVMEMLLRIKFSNPKLKQLLILTGLWELQEGNRWGDTFWGVDIRTGKGENNLGKLLMKIRKELQTECLGY